VRYYAAQTSLRRRNILPMKTKFPDRLAIQRRFTSAPFTS
jgi:hypothetical protein